jgi:hypothetical protein
MASKRPIVQRPVAQLPSGYAAMLADIKARVRAAQLKAGLAVNRELVLLYWHIGHEMTIVKQLVSLSPRGMTMGDGQ